MAANSLTVNEMIHVTGMMTEPGSDARTALERTPLLAPLVPVLEAAHERAVSAIPKPDTRLRDISVAAAGIDAVYDALAGNVYTFLTSLSGLTADKQYLELRGELLPDGVAGATQITYEAQAGFAERLKARLTPAMRERLAAIPVASGTLLDIVNDWIDAGERLGRLEQERREVAAEIAATPAGVMNEARLEWIRTINAVRAVVPLANLSEADHLTIFGLLEDIEARADQRAARRRPQRLEEDIAEELAADELPPPEAVAQPEIDT